jgi:ribosome biogenesis GTPase
LEGIVIKSTGSWYYVRDPEGTSWSCNIKGKFRMEGIRTTNPLAVGDRVDFDPVRDEAKEGLVTKLHERKNYIIRKATNLSKESHIIASNIDQAIVMATLAFPVTYPLFIDRFLVTAEAYRIPAMIIFNKIDLYDKRLTDHLNTLVDVYKKAGYECYKVSVKKEINLKAVIRLLKDKNSVLSGNSGVGKSSLINKLHPEAGLKTSHISSYHKAGKHCTTFAEMIDLPFGGHIIDTPGIKGFGLIDLGREEIYHFFPEIFKASAGCKYHNCIHSHEPGCHVVNLVEKGEISITRYKNYLRIVEDQESKYR